MISKGDAVLATDAEGIDHPAVALSPVESAGHSFPVVWVTFDDGPWARAPWPAESVRPAAPLPEESP